MATQRQYETFTLFNIRIVDMRHLWVPSDTYKGQKQQKPNYFSGFITPKTQAHWTNEPALAGLVQAMGRLHAGQGSGIVDWRIEDGDTPNAEGKSSDFAKGHWLFGGSSSSPIGVELVQTGGQLVKLPNKVGVKSGDYCMIGGAVAVSGQNNRAAKIYLNAVVFTAPGEEIVFANSVSGAELMQQAQRQGLQVAGFSGSPGFGGGQQGGFPGGGGFAPQPGGPAPGGFGGPQGGGFSPPPGGAMQHPGSAPGMAPAGFAGTPGGPATAFPSNGQGAPGFSPAQQPGNYAPTATPAGMAAPYGAPNPQGQPFPGSGHPAPPNTWQGQR